jgi:hypothetical protein
MKAITPAVTQNDDGRDLASQVPANHSQAISPDRAGMIIAGTLFLLTVAFIGCMVFTALR